LRLPCPIAPGARGSSRHVRRGALGKLRSGYPLAFQPGRNPLPYEHAKLDESIPYPLDQIDGEIKARSDNPPINIDDCAALVALAGFVEYRVPYGECFAPSGASYYCCRLELWVLPRAVEAFVPRNISHNRPPSSCL
jgi:hypothetical protein